MGAIFVLKKLFDNVLGKFSGTDVGEGASYGSGHFIKEAVSNDIDAEAVVFERGNGYIENGAGRIGLWLVGKGLKIMSAN